MATHEDHEVTASDHVTKPYAGCGSQIPDAEFGRLMTLIGAETSLNKQVSDNYSDNV